jgi:excisionase family DNA binding protein
MKRLENEMMEAVMEGTAELEMLDTKKLAKVLGVSPQTVRKWHKSGKLPAPKIPGRNCMWTIPQIKRWQQIEIESDKL